MKVPVNLFKKVLVGIVCCLCIVTLFGCGGETKQEEASAPEEPMPISDKMDTSKDPFYALVVGNDSRTGTVFIDDPNYADGAGRSDTMMLVRIDPATYQITLVSIPRDTACTLNGGTTKINEAYRLGGMPGAVQEVERLSGVSIKYYFNSGFVQFEKMVDGWSGVTANVPFEFSLSDGVSGGTVMLPAGEQTLDGSGALALARMRKEYPSDQDAFRQIQDRQLVERAIKQTAASPTRVAGDLATLYANAETNWPMDELLVLASDFSLHADSIHFYAGTGPYAGGIDETAGGLWLATRDEATWKKIMEVVNAGGDPTTVLALPVL